MSNNSSFGYEDFAKMLRESEEERKLEQQEMQIRYRERKLQKEENRRRAEEAAMKIVGMIDAAPEPQKPEEIAALAAALSHVTMAMHAAENYAEYRPITGSGLGFGI